ncbi:hypothetical protein PCASD_11140 [Puccinia coronata f. sp. avenae]|uniref:Chromosome segregation in meiosis protein n=1 Tax=Puccinia coronata f. sp. avenae TaxID=200324 RepID=A0A2N5TAA1_9BASI|nr:hypothetical protein PCASD_13467 [Puccinia coronata f. sp. avenae]PLW37173.1 hypothetical protein PCASD_11140 [Puccinia coronata f. sp. avenae]
MSEDQDHDQAQVAPTRRLPRFLGDEDMDEETGGPSTAPDESLDAFFQDLDDEEPALPEMLDHETIEAALAAKKAQALDPFALISGDKPLKRKTTRRPIVKIDEDRLLNPKIGIPSLIALSKSFKPSGKGNEKEDLKRLLKMYRLWTHSMYPKGTFRDSIDTIEKLCHKRKMRDALKTWREENAGTKSSKKAKSGEPAKEAREKEDDPSLTTGAVEADDHPEADAPPQAAAAFEGPLFRPADESEEEFPDDDQLCAFLDTVNPVPAAIPTGPVPAPPGRDSAAHRMEWAEDEFAEEEALLRDAEMAQPLPSIPHLPNSPPRPELPLPHPDSGTSINPAPAALPLTEEAHDWDDLYQ